MDDQKESVLALVRAVGELDDVAAIGAATRLAALGMDRRYIQKTVELGTRLVIDEYRRGEYFIADRLVASRLYASVMRLPFMVRAEAGTGSSRAVILGACPGDAHDAGAEAAVAALESRGIVASYLGLGVSTDELGEAAAREGAVVVAVSCMSSKSMGSLPPFVSDLRAALTGDVSVLLWGCDELSGAYDDMGADAFAEDVLALTDYCQERARGGRP